MAMLAHHRSDRLPERQAFAPAAKARLAATKRALLCTLTVLLGGGGLAAIIAVKTAMSFSRYHLGAG